jgi:hypothetical protein
VNSENLLFELIERISSQHGAVVFINRQELKEWPNDTLETFKSQRLLTQARPAQSASCPGCERDCVMPVHILTDQRGESQAVIVCDKRSDMNRVKVPIDRIEQWQASADSIADLLAKLLGLNRSKSHSFVADRWEIGMFKGIKHSGHLVLNTGDQLELTLAGYTIPLAEALSFDGQCFKVDKLKLTTLVDNPAQGGGDAESATQRRERLKKREKELRAKGVKAFLKTIADEEGISISRLKQLLQDEHESTKKSKSLW